MRKNIESFLEYLGDAVILVNADAVIVYANSACLKLFGFQRDEFIGNRVGILIEPKARKRHLNLVKTFIRDKSESKRMMSRSAFKCLTKQGHSLNARISISTMEIAECSYGVAIIQDCTTEQKIVEDITRKANADPLTMLYNRHYLESTTLADNRWLSSRSAIAVLFLDLDNFKPMNDLYGHAFGDFILKTVALRMKETLRQDDLVFRVGGDEFVVLLALDTVCNNLEISKKVAKKLHQEISRTIEFEDTKMNVFASIGLGLYPHDFNDLEITIKLADKAMYFAKKHKLPITCVAELSKII